MIDVYYKTKLIVKIIKSTDWQNKVEQFAKSFSGLKDELRMKLLLIIHNNTNDTNSVVTNTDTKIDLVLALLRRKTEFEAELLKFIKGNGGIINSVGNDEFMGKLVRKFEGVGDDLGPQTFGDQILSNLPGAPRPPPFAPQSTTLGDPGLAQREFVPYPPPPLLPPQFTLLPSYSPAATTGYGPLSPPSLVSAYSRQTQSAWSSPFAREQVQSSSAYYRPSAYSSPNDPPTRSYRDRVPRIPTMNVGLGIRQDLLPEDWARLPRRSRSPSLSPTNGKYPRSGRPGIDVDTDSVGEEPTLPESPSGMSDGRRRRAFPPPPRRSDTLDSQPYPQRMPSYPGYGRYDPSPYNSGPYFQSPPLPQSWSPPTGSQAAIPYGIQRTTMRTTVATRPPEDEILELSPPTDRRLDPSDYDATAPLRVRPALIEAYRLEINYAIRTPLTQILAKNEAIWSFKLDHTTNELKAHIDKSTSVILRALAHAQASNHANDTQKGKEGPHSRINDPELRSIWFAEKWRGSVLASAFFQALQDYFLEAEEEGAGENEGWARTFLGMGWRIGLEGVVDRDGSGYVSVSEVNRWSGGKARRHEVCNLLVPSV